ncbi:hypothetical protein GGI35DRAFT_490755 [Trichoderma velutinum]
MSYNMNTASSKNSHGRFRSSQSPGQGPQSQFKSSSPSASPSSAQGLKSQSGDVDGSSTSAHVSSLDESKAPFIGPVIKKFGKGGGGFRSIDEKLEVNPSNGTMSLSIPIHTSSGRSGFGPSLSLGYDSGYGNGPFGIGWSLSLDSISRKVSRAIPTYGVSDVFILSGQEDLVTYGEATDKIDLASGKEYSVQYFKPRVVADPLHIQRWTLKEDDSHIFWKVIRGDNVTQIFGNSISSRVFDDSFGSSRTFQWLLSECYDGKGNAMLYTYKHEDTAGTSGGGNHQHTANRYLRSIKYGNQTPSRSINDWDRISLPEQWLLEVIFDYGEHEVQIGVVKEIGPWKQRKDPFSTYISGFEIRTSRLCRNIFMIHRFPELGGEMLVSSTSLQYDETERGSFLSNYTIHGYNKNDKGDPIVDSSSPISFNYSKSCSAETLQVAVADAPALRNVQDGSLPQWIDLNGEGSPGLLQTSFPHGSWTYQSNENAAVSIEHLQNGTLRFGAPLVLGSQPSLSMSRDVIFEDFDGNGIMDVMCCDRHGKLIGFHERHNASDWLDLQLFKSVPNFDYRGSEFAMLDVTGDGLQDIIHFDESQDQVLWYASLAKDGFSDLQNSKRVHDGPYWRSSQRGALAGIATFLADMSGDGLDDIVQISNGAVSYWPNMGYGHFGGEIIMNNAPVFDRDVYDPSRLILSDIDGSGTTDIIYLPPGGGAHLYYNLAGNGWSNLSEALAFPETRVGSPAFVTDLFGRGVPCLCVVLTDDNGVEPKLHYMDLSGGVKAHLMTQYTNGVGLITDIEYQPSTYYYLQDKAAGTPWFKPLHFPVQCVSKLRIEDELAQTEVFTSYTYHDGYYDGFDKEFRGFGLVDTKLEENYSLGSSKVHKGPPIYSRTWYLTGSMHVDDLARSLPQNSLHIKNTFESESVSSAQTRESYRVLKGQIKRREIFVRGTNSKPQQTTEYSYEAKTVQRVEEKMSVVGHGISRLVPREVITCCYETGPESATDPRIQRDVVLEVNEYGDPLKVMKLSYGRDEEQAKSDALLNESARRQQAETIATMTENTYTNDVKELHSFRKPLICTTREFRLSGLKSQFTSFDELVALDIDHFDLVSLNDFSTTEGQCRALVKENRIIYTSNDPNKELDHKKLEAYSVECQRFELCLTPDLLKTIQDTFGSGDEMRKNGGYVTLDAKDHWWTASARLGYKGPDGYNPVEYARSTFFMPNISTDIFDNIYATKFDKYHLLLEESEDPLGNITKAQNNYQCLQPTEITDCNGNRQKVVHNGFAEVVGFARMGKSSEQVGETLERFDHVILAETIETLLHNPTQEVLKDVLGDATRRVIHQRNRYHESKPLRSLPNLTVELSRQDHDNSELPNDIILNIQYFSGRGKILETCNLLSDSSPRWRISSRDVLDNANTIVRTFHSRLAASCDFCKHDDIGSPSAFSFNDALGRNIGTLAANGLWTKTRHLAWGRDVFHSGNTILLDALTDEDIGIYAKSLDPVHLGSWYNSRTTSKSEDEASSAKKSKVYADMHITQSLDAKGNEILGTHRLSPSTILNGRIVYDALGTHSSIYDTVERDNQLVERLTERLVYDLIGRQIVRYSLDAGNLWNLPDCNGAPMLSYNDREITRRVSRDKLRRESKITMRQGTEPNERAVLLFEYGDSSEDESHNCRNKVVRIYDQAGKLTISDYDFKGNQVRSARQYSDDFKSVLDWNDKNAVALGTGQETIAVYNALNKPIMSINSVGDVTRQAYDSIGRSSSTEWKSKSGKWEKYVRSIEYTHDDLESSIEYGNKTSVVSEYDQVTRHLIRQTTFRKDSKRPNKTVTLADWTWTHDCVGRITSARNASEEIVFYRNAMVNPALDYSYDALGRLVQCIGREQVHDPAVEPYHATVTKKSDVASNYQAAVVEYLETYKYDVAGNMKEMHHEPVDKGISRAWTRSYTYTEESKLETRNFSNRLTSTTIQGYTETYRYEGSAGSVGCMTSMSGFANLIWDMDNRLRSITRQVVNDGTGATTWYVYDYNGDRIRKVVESEALSNEQPKVLKDIQYLPLLQMELNFNGQGVVVKSKIMSTVGNIGGSTAAVVEMTSTEKTPDPKPLIRYQTGSGMETDNQGSLISYEEYSPFGTTTYVAARNSIDAPSRYRYAKYDRDTETGLYYCKARFYAPWICRWLSADPWGSVDGPNLYAYCRNDPINHSDPRGTMRNQSQQPGRMQNLVSLFFRRGNGNAQENNSNSGPSRVNRGQAQNRNGIGQAYDRLNADENQANEVDPHLDIERGPVRFLDDTLRLLGDKINTLNNSVEGLTNELSVSRAESLALKAEVAALKGAVEITNSNVGKLDASLITANGNIDKLNTTTDKLNTTLAGNNGVLNDIRSNTYTSPCIGRTTLVLGILAAIVTIVGLPLQGVSLHLDLTEDNEKRVQSQLNTTNTTGYATI